MRYKCRAFEELARAKYAESENGKPVGRSGGQPSSLRAVRSLMASGGEV
jgi:hypothetical protein